MNSKVNSKKGQRHEMKFSATLMYLKLFKLHGCTYDKSNTLHHKCVYKNVFIGSIKSIWLQIKLQILTSFQFQTKSNLISAQHINPPKF